MRRTPRKNKPATRLKLGQIKDNKSVSILPSRYRSTKFIHYSIPSFSDGMPSEVYGAEITSPKYIVSNGDVLLSKINPYINRVWVVKSTAKAVMVASKEWEIFPRLDGIDPNYLALFLSQKWVIDYMVANSSGIGSSLSRTSREALDTLEIPLPSIDKQQRIAESVNAKLSNLSQVERKIRSTIELIEEYGLRFAEEILSGDKAAPTEPTVKELKEIPFKNISRSGTIKQYKLHELCERISVGNTGAIVDRYQDAGIPILRSHNVKPNSLDLTTVKYIDRTTHEILANSSVEPGDILVVRTGKIGEAATIPFDLPEANCSDVLIIKTPKIPSAYLCYYINSILRNLLQDGSYGTVISHLNASTLSQVIVNVPSDEEMQQVADALSEVNIYINETISKLIASLEEVQNSRLSIIDETFREISNEDDDPATIQRLYKGLADLAARRESEVEIRDRIKIDADVELDISLSRLENIIKSSDVPIATGDILALCGYKPSDGVEALEDFYRHITLLRRNRIIVKTRRGDDDFFEALR